MAKKIKYKHVINWNIITIVLTLLALITTVILNYNQRELSALKTENSLQEKAIADLKSQLDPAWQEKFNTQRQYYENEVLDRDKKIKVVEVNIDNLRKKSYTSDTNHITLPVKLAKKIAIDLIRGERDSILVGLYLQKENLLEQRLTLKTQMIDNQSAQISKLFELLQLEKSIKKGTSTNITLITLLIALTILSLLSAFISYYKFRVS